MSVIKCKMCGGELSFEEGQTVCECEYCGSKQTLPSMDSEKIVTLFGRAGRLLRSCEFDKASAIFENIVAENPEEAEAYWGLVLCKFGIEYVDDPATGKKVPTCHRSSFDSVMDDADFEQACENADGIARKVYREEAKQIEELRRSIIAVSEQEQPYDIFISYKEKDDDGERTLDSVLAQDLYDALTGKGYRVFFSRISLEDKLGVEYEPYIFAALNSAKVMLVVGTDFDYFNAVWVKNEWSRYLKLMAKDKSRHLIPCFKGIDAYDMPKEFNKLTAQDLGKVGATQDLLRGIDKLIGKEAAPASTGAPVQQTIVQQVVGGGPNVTALLQRGEMSLEDGAFDEAKDFYNQVLNSNAQSAEAYLGLFMADIQCCNMTQAKNKYVAGDYTENRYWKRANQYAEGSLKAELQGWEKGRNDRLAREAEATRKAKEEAERKAREAEEAEEAKRKALTEKREKLAEQLKSGDFDLSESEKAELSRLQAAAETAEAEYQKAESVLQSIPEKKEKEKALQEISEKRTIIQGLGFFKGKEKRALEEQITSLEGIVSRCEAKIDEKTREVTNLKKKAGEAKALTEEYKKTASAGAKEKAETQIKTITKELAETILAAFGSYEQVNGKEPIEWNVLAVKETRVLAISRYALDCKPYNTESKSVTWETCSLRNWLNGEFLNTAFSKEEQARIPAVTVTADKNPSYSTDAGKDTQDKVFLLSIEEVNKYFSSNEERKCAVTPYAKSQGAWTDSDTVGGMATGWWWLRSPGNYSSVAAVVDTGGSVNDYGRNVNLSNYVVRPALWIEI